MERQPLLKAPLRLLGPNSGKLDTEEFHLDTAFSCQAPMKNKKVMPKERKKKSSCENRTSAQQEITFWPGRK
jgi:hypothetical protein